jgi:hypothetical protein
MSAKGCGRGLRSSLGVEEANHQLRFDFLNLFNHANLDPVDGNMADLNNFGKVTSVLPVRQIQPIARMSF